MSLLTLGNMLMQLNPNTRHSGNAMMQGGGALIQMQIDQEEREARAKAEQEQSLKETMLKLAGSGNSDPAMYKLALKEHGVDPSSPRAKTWLGYATSKEGEQRKQAQMLLGEAGAALFDQTKLPLKDLLSVMEEKRQGEKMEMDRQQHAEQMEVSRGNLSVSQQRLAMDREEAQRDIELANELMALLGDEEGGVEGAQQAAGVAPTGGQVIPVGEGQVTPTGPEQAAPVTSDGWTGIPRVDKALKAGFMLAAKGDTGRANALISGARVLADKSPEGRRAEIQQKIDEALRTPLAPDELVKYQKGGQPLPPGTTMADLMGPGALELRPNQPLPEGRQEALLGAMNNLRYVAQQKDAVTKGVKTGLAAGPFSWAKSYLGFENEAQFRVAQEHANVAAQSLITGIPSNFDAERFERTQLGFSDHPTVLKEKAYWQEELSKQLIRTTVAYYKGSSVIIPPAIIDAARDLGVDPDSVGSFNQEDKKLVQMGDRMEKRINYAEKRGAKGTEGFSLDTDLSKLNPSQREAYSNWLREQGY